jgi:hypothetical protein
LFLHAYVWVSFSLLHVFDCHELTPINKVHGAMQKWAVVRTTTWGEEECLHKGGHLEDVLKKVISFVVWVKIIFQ